MRTIARKRKKKQRQGYIYILLSVLALAVVFYLFLQRPDNKKNSAAMPAEHFPSILQIIAGRDNGKNMPSRPTKDIKLPVIKSIRFLPAEPTVVDSIKAEALTDYDQGNVIYEYLWEINSKTVKDIKDNTLPAGLFKKGDAIRVIVTPFAEGSRGYPYESRFIVIHSAPPSLELKEMTQGLADIVEFQLISNDPDGDKVTFSLEEPYLQGMTINKETGKIIWKPEKKGKGTYKFRASSVDTDGAKITKTFEFKID